VAEAPPVTYSNPFYAAAAATSSEPTVVESSAYEVPPALDYSQPIAVPTEKEVRDTDSDVTLAAQQRMDAGRAAFRRGDYEEARKQTEQALELLPGDANLHEFRALCLFALERYRDAAAAVYAVLAAGPGWDWATLRSFYPSVLTYQKQLRALEGHIRSHLKEAEGRFLLAYHYLALNERDAALDQLNVTVELQPKDQLSRSLAEALTKDQQSRHDKGE
jgi:tetratricopeptide (TPR) repeat protein